jgi:subtilisin family serine protease
MAGTSMAAPEVTGAAVLVRQALEEAGLLDPDPANQVDQILKILQDTGTPLYDNYFVLGGNNSTLMEIPPGSKDYYYGRGTFQDYMLINVEAAINSVLPVPEAGTVGMLGLGVLVLGKRRRAHM